MEMNRVFELLQAHSRVIYAAVYRVGITQCSSDFDTYVARGQDVYLAYGQRYVDPVETTVDIVKFNRLAGYFIYRTLCGDVQRNRRNQAKFGGEMTPALMETVPAADCIEQASETAAVVEALWRRLTSRERQVFRLCFDEGLGSRAIAERLGLSQRNVNRLRQQVRAKYMALRKDWV